MKKIAVFDFDRTLIEKDSMVIFLFRYFNFKSFKNMLRFVKLFFETALFFLKIYSQIKYKEKFLNSILISSKTKDLNKISLDSSNYLIEYIFPQALSKIKKLEEEGYELVLLSASPDFLLKNIASKLGFSKLIATKTNIINKKIIVEKNCYGKNKLKMLLDEYNKGDVNWEQSYCFADDSSDKYLLDYFGNPIVINNKRLAKRNPRYKYVEWK